MNLERLLMQSTKGEMVFSKAIDVAANTTFSVGRPLPVTNSQSQLPKVLFICQRIGDSEFQIDPCTAITTSEQPFEVLAENETKFGPLNMYVRWRVERRFGEPIICSTFIASRSKLEREIGTESLPPNAEEAIITIEHYISNKWKRIRRKTRSAPPDLDEIPKSPLIIITSYYKKRIELIPTTAIGPLEDFLVMDQDIEFTHRPFGLPDHWRIERRGNEEIYCSTKTMTSQEIRKLGAVADLILDSQPKMRITFENYPSDSWQKIRTPVLDPRTGKVYSLAGFWRWERRRIRDKMRYGNPVVSVSNWKPLKSGSLRGFLTVTVRSGLIIHDCQLLEAGGKRWIRLPAHRFQSADGSRKYQPLVEFTSKHAALNFRESVLRAIEKHLGLE